LTGRRDGKPIWSAQYSLSPPRAALAPRDRLRALEQAAAAKPADVRVWNEALGLIRQGSVTDDDVGAGASIDDQPPLRVAVVTPYFREDLAVLSRCHASVAAQTHPCRHVMVADGFPRDEIDAWDVEHVRLDRPHADFGDTPRAVGGERALAAGCDAIAYLDGDNALRAHHVESLVRRHRATGAPVIFSGRTLHLPTGQTLPGIDPEDGRAHVDTNCLFLAGDARAMGSAWTAYPRPLSAVGDRVVVRMLQARGFPIACTGALTVRYTVNDAHFYRALQLPVPPDARPDFDMMPLAAYCRSLGADDWARLATTLGFPVEAFLRDFVRRRGIELA
jgi:hypothetical protein